ncbi:hypothetical protein TrRE_jg3433 [Triparma retinervis]|uniref:SET domain-containing protein n=1 Tax=Triparma retinervis TaxID=2557542 RepID=A0A9W7CI12_9STRA|nr:hypothetical protein TrRE_jg3433 [Triparma retinervis]
MKKLSQTPIRGRVITTSHFPLRSTLLVEQPLLTWSSCCDDFASNLYTAFLNASKSNQELILDFFHPDLTGETDYLSSASSASSALSLPTNHQSVTLLHTLLIIANFNAHNYTFASTSIPHSGLFHVASKFEHSCCPNVHGSTSTSSMVYLALSPLPVGTYVASSYLGPALHLPLQDRREELMETKYFHCQCERCGGRDHCRPLFCALPTCEGVMLMCGRTEKWICGECEGVVDGDSDVIEEREAKEGELISSLDDILRSFDSVAKHYDALLGSLDSLRLLAAPTLPPLHHFWFTFHTSLSTLHALVAASAPQSTRNNHLILSAMESFEAVEWKNEINNNIVSGTTKLQSRALGDGSTAAVLKRGMRERIKQAYKRFEPCVGSVEEAYGAGMKFHEAGETELAKIVLGPYVDFIEHAVMREGDVRMDVVRGIVEEARRSGGKKKRRI